MTPKIREKVDSLTRLIVERPYDVVSRLNLADTLEGAGLLKRATLIRAGYNLSAGTSSIIKYRHIQRVYADRALRDWDLFIAIPWASRKTLRASVVGNPRWRRWVRIGFLEQVEVLAEDFMLIAKDLFQAMPIKRVRLLDVQAVRLVGGVDKDLSPQEWLTKYDRISALEPVSRLLPPWAHASKRAARLTLSDVCVAYGRKVAGLPELARNDT